MENNSTMVRHGGLYTTAKVFFCLLAALYLIGASKGYEIVGGLMASNRSWFTFLCDKAPAVLFIAAFVLFLKGCWAQGVGIVFLGLLLDFSLLIYCEAVYDKVVFGEMPIIISYLASYLPFALLLFYVGTQQEGTRRFIMVLCLALGGLALCAMFVLSLCMPGAENMSHSSWAMAVNASFEEPLMYRLSGFFKALTQLSLCERYCNFNIFIPYFMVGCGMYIVQNCEE